jgi:hypothetical protein
MKPTLQVVARCYRSAHDNKNVQRRNPYHRHAIGAEFGNCRLGGLSVQTKAYSPTTAKNTPRIRSWKLPRRRCGRCRQRGGTLIVYPIRPRLKCIECDERRASRRSVRKFRWSRHFISVDVEDCQRSRSSSDKSRRLKTSRSVQHTSKCPNSMSEIYNVDRSSVVASLVSILHRRRWDTGL